MSPEDTMPFPCSPWHSPAASAPSCLAGSREKRAFVQTHLLIRLLFFSTHYGGLKYPICEVTTELIAGFWE